MDGIQTSLKEPRIFRVFISSPFNGMEVERDALTKFYWPRLESLLSTKGLRLRLVDMRWGITHSSSVDSDTINICLREIDRSDYFVGLYAQRYGWHGTSDAGLQDNFNKAMGRFPWIEKHRDKSVTELEYRHAFLNNPGKVPTCFTFRHKGHDDEMILKARQEGNIRQERVHSSESPEALNLLEKLKEEVNNSEGSTRKLLSDYLKPDAAAEFIFNSVIEFVKNHIISSSVEPLSKKEKSLLAHEIYLKSRAGKYIGGQRYVDELNNYLGDEESKPLTVTGQTGCGKSALIAHWLLNFKNEKSSDIFTFYHLVGAEPASASSGNLLIRLVENLHLEINGEEFDPTSIKLEDKPLLSKLKELFKHVEDGTCKSKRKIVIFVDKIDHMNMDKTSKPLFWLPTSLPKEIKMILTVTVGHQNADEILDVLEEEYKSLRLDILPLSQEDQLQMCQVLLEEHSKSFDSEQLDLIIASQKTNQPFFLLVLIQELCVSGKFRQLKEQIQTLLNADGVTGLMCEVIKRVEQDYDHDSVEGNLVEDVLCAISLCRKGIAESELPMPQHAWAPLIYSMEKYLINKGGLLSFSFPEMAEAVEQMYMNTPEKKMLAAGKVSKIFLTPYMNLYKGKERRSLDKRIALELPYLLMQAGDKENLLRLISDVRVFSVMFDSARYELNEYWQYVGVPADAISRRLLKNIDCYVADRYAYHIREYNQEKLVQLMRWKSTVIDDIRRWMDIIKLYRGLELVYTREILLDERRPGFTTEMKRVNLVTQVKYFKACFLSDSEKYHESLDLHKHVLEGRKKLIEANIMDAEDIGMSYHGIGLCYYNLKDYDEGEKWFKMALEAQDETNPKNQTSNANTYCNLGLIEMAREKYSNAIECFNKSNALWERASPDRLALDVAYNYHNLALVYRRKKDYDEAERMYMKSLKLKERLLGPEAFDVAITLMNLGTVETYRKNNEKSLDYNKKALALFKKLAPEGSSRVMMAEENVVNQLTLLNRYEEADPMFQNVLRFLKTMSGGSANGLAPLHRRFIKWYHEKGFYVKALDVSNGLVRCSKCRGSDVAYHMLLYNDAPVDQNGGDCIHEGTFEYGLEKWPDSRDLLMAKLGLLIDISEEETLKFVRSFCEENGPGPQPEKGRYFFCAEIAKDELELIDFAINIVKQGLEYEPNSEDLKGLLESYSASKVKEENQESNT